MPEGWVFDSSPLIVLGRIQALDLLARLPGTIIVPKQVATELKAGPHSDPARVWITSRACRAKKPSIRIPARVVAWRLGNGESSVISYALAHRAHMAVLDDRRGRSCASGIGVRLIGTLGCSQRRSTFRSV